MKKKISRRDFLKLAGASAATGAALTGCGPSSRFVVREPYTQMPEYALIGESTFYATTCRECAAGCGLIVRTFQGRAIKVEGNKNNPVNLGKTCARGQATLQGLYNPDRVTDPLKQGRRKTLGTDGMNWDEAIKVVSDALANTGPAGIGFLLGMTPDHLFDLVSDLTAGIGAPAPVRYGALSAFEARATLVKAAENVLGQSGLPFFDLAHAELTFSFGANFLETWLSPVAYTRGFSKMRKQGKRGYLVQFEPRMSQTGAKADEWIPVRPGTEGMVALALGKLIAESKKQTVPRAFVNVDVKAVAKESDVDEEKLHYLADLFADADRALAIPGGAALGQSNGLGTAEAVLALDALANNFGQPGGVFLSPAAPTEDNVHRPASLQEMAVFINKMNTGEIKTLLIHGVNPVFELPKSLGFEAALKNVPLVISFSTFPDEAAILSDYIFPDHHGLESWGYQRVATGTSQSTLSGAQPVVSPFYNTQSTADVLLAASAIAGGKLASALPFKDEVEYIQAQLIPLIENKDANFNAGEINSFSAYFQQFGGWWTNEAALLAPTQNTLNETLSVESPTYEGEGDFFLVPFVSPVLGEAGANKPSLQEVPDPTTTVMWNSWVEINPETAHEFGIKSGDIIKIVSNVGVIETSAYLYPAIRPDTIAIPFGQGHKAYGRYAAGRGVNPFDLLGLKFNAAGDIAFAGMKVQIIKTGKKFELARMESEIGVYGEGLGEE